MRTDLEINRADNKLDEAKQILGQIKEAKVMYRRIEKELLESNLDPAEKLELMEMRYKCLITIGKLDAAFIITSLDAVFMPDNHGFVHN